MGYPTDLDDRTYDIHRRMVELGHWRDAEIVIPDDPAEPRYAPARTLPNPSFAESRIAYMHSELSEALEALRAGDMEKVGAELADCIIRILDFSGGFKINMEHEVARAQSRLADLPGADEDRDVRAARLGEPVPRRRAEMDGLEERRG